jgi:3-dehydroquinate synthetase
MIAATQIALSTGRLDPVSAERITSATVSLGKLPRVKFQVAGVLKRLQTDKKTRQGVMHLVLPTQIGKVEIVNDVRTSVVRAAIEEIRKLAVK